MRTIDRWTLLDLIEHDPDTRVISALGPTRFRAAHIPRSETFTSIADLLATTDPDTTIVVHGSNAADFSGPWLWRILRSHGYGDVRIYPGGLADWANAGLPLEGTGVLAVAPLATAA
jgi:3-mercaptopyruvate sulfurtransferase SseA